MLERLQKVVAATGLASRRQAEAWIEQGRFKVDGRLATLGQKVSSRSKIEFDGRPLRTTKPTRLDDTRVIAYHKPIGEICTKSDPEKRTTVFSKLPSLKSGRWIAIGRLDLNTSGLLLFTNNGELANQLMHPSSGLEREYAVRVFGEPLSEKETNSLKKGIQLEDGKAAFSQLKPQGGQGINRWYHVVLKEGRNRVVRRLWQAVDRDVSRLIRIRFGHIRLPDRLPIGQFKELTEQDMAPWLKASS